MILYNLVQVLAPTAGPVWGWGDGGVNVHVLYVVYGPLHYLNTSYWKYS